VQIGFGQTRRLGNRGHRGAAKAGAGKDALGRSQNKCFVGLAYLAF
jgi:hypothetical protein